MAWVILLGAADVALTAYGWQLGVFVEANPVILSLLDISPLLAFGAAFLIPAALVAAAWRLRDRSRWVRPAMRGLVALRVAVLGLHVPWLLVVFGLA